MDNFEELVNKLQEEERYDEVIELCEKELQDNPDNAQAYYEKARAEHKLKRHPVALIDINKSIEIYPNELNYTLKGYILWRLKDKKAAIEFFSKALEYNDESLEALEGRCYCHYFEHDYEEALKDAHNILSIHVNDAEALNVIGNIERNYGNYDIAIKTLKNSIENDSNNRASLHWSLANCYCDIKEYDCAIIEYQKAIEIDETYADAYWMIGNVYKYKKDLNTAIEYYTKAINLYPKGYQQGYFADRAFAYKEIKEFNKALDDIKTAIELDCSDAEFYWLKSSIEYEMNIKEEAIEDLKKSLDCNNKFMPSYIGLICLYSEQTKYKEARKYLKQGLKIEPNNSELIKLQDELQKYTLWGKLKTLFKKNK